MTNKKGGLESNLGERKVILRGVEGSQVGEGVHGGGRGGGQDYLFLALLLVFLLSYYNSTVHI